MMNMKLRQLLAAFIVWVPFLLPARSAQAQSRISRQGNVISLSNAGKQLRLEFCTPQMVRIRTSNTNTFLPDEPWMVVKYQWEAVPLQASTNAAAYVITTAAIRVTVQRSSLGITIHDANGNLLSDEVRTLLVAGNDTVGTVKKLAADEHFFGFGERMDFLDQRSKKVTLNVGRGASKKGHLLGAYNVNAANYAPVPFFMSTRGYGIFLHNAYPSFWDMGQERNDQYSIKAAGGELDYYFIYGPKFAGIIDAYTTLTGKSPLMPRFAFGLHLGTYSGGTWRYESQTSDRYVIALARKMREMGIPVDLMWLDSTWRIFGEKGGKGATSFEWRETFTDPRHMFDTLYAMKYKMVGLHLRPRIDNGKTLRLLEQGQALGYTYPEGGYAGEFVNYFDTAAANWWWEQGVMKVASIGAKFLKTDEGSSFGGLANESDKMGPTGKKIASLHNLYPIAYAKTPYEKFQEYNGIRGMNQTREGFAGIQRYPFIFAGDWPSEWQYFAPVIKAGLNIGMSGVGNWSHCMGGFEHNADPELYMRWVQFGMFSPVALVFGMDHPGYKEPWNYGGDALKNFKKYDSLRYALMPYIYTNAWKMYKTGSPIMSALVMHYQDDENVYSIADQYLFGDDMMVCPVTTKGAGSRTVYLPEGDWINYWTGEQYSGKKYLEVVAPQDIIPIFVKAGAIIPMEPSMRYMDEYPVDLITLDIFPGKNGAFDLYEDDGSSQQYKEGKYAITSIKATTDKLFQRINIRKPEGQYLPTTHQYLLKLRMKQAPVALDENGVNIPVLTAYGKVQKQTGWYYDEAAGILWVHTANDNTKHIEVSIK